VRGVNRALARGTAGHLPILKRKRGEIGTPEEWSSEMPEEPISTRKRHRVKKREEKNLLYGRGKTTFIGARTPEGNSGGIGKDLGRNGKPPSASNPNERGKHSLSVSRKENFAKKQGNLRPVSGDGGCLCS